MKRLLVVGCLLLGTSLVVASEDAAAKERAKEKTRMEKQLETAKKEQDKAQKAFDKADEADKAAKKTELDTATAKVTELDAKLNPAPEAAPAPEKPSIFAKYLKNPVVNAGKAVKDETGDCLQFVETHRVIAAAGIIALLYAGKYIGPWMDKGAEFIKTKCPCHPPRQQEDEEVAA